MGFPQLLSNGVIASGELVVQAAVNACGVVFVTGITAARRYFNLINVIGFGLEGAVVTYVGQNYGAGEYDRIRRGTRTAIRLGVGSALLSGILVYLLAEPMILFFVPEGSPETITVGVEALRVQSVFLVFLYLLCEHRAAIQGMGNAIIPMLSGFMELGVRIACTLLLPVVIGREGLYFTDSAAWVPTALMLIISYHVVKKRRLREEP
jgi:Na+-driven multidrug efflux pump